MDTTKYFAFIRKNYLQTEIYYIHIIKSRDNYVTLKIMNPKLVYCSTKVKLMKVKSSLVVTYKAKTFILTVANVNGFRIFEVKRLYKNIQFYVS